MLTVEPFDCEDDIYNRSPSDRGHSSISGQGHMQSFVIQPHTVCMFIPKFKLSNEGKLYSSADLK